MQTNKFTVIIPARMQSSRLANKMLLPIGKYPLIVCTAMQALKSAASDVIVATDHIEIKEACSKHNIKAIMTMDTHQSGTDRLSEAANILGLSDDDIVINVQGDEPLISPTLINQLGNFMHNQKASIATIAHPIHLEEEIFNPHVVKVVLDEKQNALYFSRAPIPYYRDGFINRTHFNLPKHLNILRHVGIYAYSVEFLKEYKQLQACPLEQVEQLEQLRAMYYGYKIAVSISNEDPTTGVDTLEDLQRIRQLTGNNHAN